MLLADKEQVKLIPVQVTIEFPNPDGISRIKFRLRFTTLLPEAPTEEVVLLIKDNEWLFNQRRCWNVRSNCMSVTLVSPWTNQHQDIINDLRSLRALSLWEELPLLK